MQGILADVKCENIKIDTGIKTILAISLAITASFCNNRLDLLYFTLYLVVVTILLKSDLRFILKNLASYGIIIVFPYLCGLLFSLFISNLFPGPAYFNSYSLEATLFKMIKIFFIWYIFSLYFFTTPFISIVEMLNKVFFPLNSLGVPVSKYLNMILCIVDQLTKSVDSFKKEIMEQARYIIKNNRDGIKNKSKELSNILVNFIANSLQRTDEIEQVDLTQIINSQYTLVISKNEIIAITSLAVFLMLFLADL